MTAYPFINFKNHSVKVGANTTLLLGSQVTLLVDSLLVLNKGNQDVLFNMDLLKEVSGQPKTVHLLIKKRLDPHETQNLLGNGLLYLEPGDLLYGYTDFSGSLVEITASYRELNTTTPQNTTKTEAS